MTDPLIQPMKSQPDRFALPFIRLSLIGAAVLAMCAGPALAVNPFVVKDIRVEGIQRTEAGTVFSYLPVRVGETFDDDKGTVGDTESSRNLRRKVDVARGVDQVNQEFVACPSLCKQDECSVKMNICHPRSSA